MSSTGILFLTIVVIGMSIFFLCDHIEILGTLEEIIICAFWLPGFLIKNLIHKEYSMTIAEYYYSPLKRYFVRHSKKLVIDLLSPDNLELHYCKGHIIKHPEINEIDKYTREMLFECGLLKYNI